MLHSSIYSQCTGDDKLKELFMQHTYAGYKSEYKESLTQC